jgi:uncharacterized protein
VNSVRVPVVDGDSARYWDAASHDSLIIPLCEDCERVFFYPRTLCPECHGDRIGWKTASGLGTVYSYTISRRPPSPDLADLVPYVVALIDLDEGIRMMSNVVGVDAATLRVGQRVQVRFERVSEEIKIPVFEPTEEQ